MPKNNSLNAYKSYESKLKLIIEFLEVWEKF